MIIMVAWLCAQHSADIGAGRLLAHGDQPMRAQDPPRLAEPPARRRHPHADPVRLAQHRRIRPVGLLGMPRPALVEDRNHARHSTPASVIPEGASVGVRPSGSDTTAQPVPFPDQNVSRETPKRSAPFAGISSLLGLDPRVIPECASAHIRHPRSQPSAPMSAHAVSLVGKPPHSRQPLPSCAVSTTASALRVGEPRRIVARTPDVARYRHPHARLEAGEIACAPSAAPLAPRPAMPAAQLRLERSEVIATGPRAADGPPQGSLQRIASARRVGGSASPSRLVSCSSRPGCRGLWRRVRMVGPEARLVRSPARAASAARPRPAGWWPGAAGPGC